MEDGGDLQAFTGPGGSSEALTFHHRPAAAGRDLKNPSDPLKRPQRRDTLSEIRLDHLPSVIYFLI